MGGGSDLNPKDILLGWWYITLCGEVFNQNEQAFQFRSQR
jgi:hypothetical protein